jgi:hypothetical protein
LFERDFKDAGGSLDERALFRGGQRPERVVVEMPHQEQGYGL